MRKYPVREIAEMSYEQLWNECDEDVIVCFEDGVEEVMSWRSVIISAYLWDIQRDFVEVPICSNHAVRNETFKKSTVSNLITNILRSIRDHASWMDKEYIMKSILQILNVFHNTFISKTQEFVTSVNAVDMMEIVESDEVRAIMNEFKPTHFSISRIYKQGSDLLHSDNWKFRNPMKRAVRWGVVNEQQFNQVTFCRGFGTDINGRQFNTPLASGFARGLHKFHDLIVESRSSAKAVYQQIDPIATTEYFSRRLQLVNEIVRHLYPGFCGTQQTVPLMVTKTNFGAAVGSYYQDEQGQPKPIREEDKAHILEKGVIRIYSALTCEKLARNGICEVCMGEFCTSLAKGISPGHTIAIGVGEETSQKVLGTKHLDKSIEVKAFKPNQEDRKYIEVCNKEGNQIRLVPELLKKYHLTLFVSNESLAFLAEVSHSEDRETIQLSRVSSVEELGIAYQNKKTKEESLHAAKVSDSSRVAYFTSDFLDYILALERIEYVGSVAMIPLDKWDITKPVVELPLKRESMEEYLKNFASILESQIAKMKLDPNTEEGLSDILVIIYRALEEFVNVPFGYVALIAATMMARNKKERDYRLPRVGEARDFGQRGPVFVNRSLSQAMAYEKHADTLVTPFVFTNSLRTNHPFDCLIMPGIADVFEDFKPGVHLPPELRPTE